MNNLNIISEEARKSILLSEEGAKKKVKSQQLLQLR